MDIKMAENQASSTLAGHNDSDSTDSYMNDIEELMRTAQSLIDESRLNSRFDNFRELEEVVAREVADESFVSLSTSRSSSRDRPFHVRSPTPIPIETSPPTTPPRDSMLHDLGRTPENSFHIIIPDDVIFIDGEIEPPQATERRGQDDPVVVDLCTPQNLNRIVPRSRRIEVEPIVITSDDEYGAAVEQPIRARHSRRQNRLQAVSTSPIQAGHVPVQPDTQERHLASAICPICMDALSNKSLSSTICGHVFCSTCIKTAFSMNPKCPLCNKKLKKSMILPLFVKF